MSDWCSWISGFCTAVSACAAAASAYYTRKTLQKSNEDRKIALLTERAVYYRNLVGDESSARPTRDAAVHGCTIPDILLCSIPAVRLK